MANALPDPLGLNKMIGGLLGIKEPQNTVLPTPPSPPATDPDSITARDAAVAEGRRKRVAMSRTLTNPTGGLGDTSYANAVSKSLLGA